MEQIPDNIFEVKLDETGKSYIRKIYKLSGLLLFGGLILTVFLGIIQIVRFIKHNQSNASGLWPNLILKVYPFINFVLLILNIIALVYYFKFSKGLAKSIADDNPVRFNNSFKYLYSSIVLNLLVVALSLAASIIIGIGQYKYNI
jgi:hypothetical protein